MASATVMRLRPRLGQRSAYLFRSVATAHRGYDAKRALADASSNGFQRRSESPYRSLSKLTLIGRTGSRPQARTFEDGSRSLNISVATSHRSVNSTQAECDTQWHSVFVSQSTPGFSLFEQLPTGSQLYVEGLMRIKTVERDGEKLQFVNVNVSSGYGMIRVLSTPRGGDLRGEGELEDEGGMDEARLPF
ncbi:unnamed protein product [Agarophyton chilense]